MQDRTNEFMAAVESLQSRHSGAMHAAQLMSRLESHANSSGDAGDTNRLLSSSSTREKKTDFARMAASIGREITDCAHKLEKLAKCKVVVVEVMLLVAKKKSLFDDRPVEIQDLTFIIKQDISKINNQIKSLEQYLLQNGAKLGNKQTLDHSSGVVVSLQTKLADASISFKDVLEIRTQNMKVQRERRDQFGVTPASSHSRGSTLLFISSHEKLAGDSTLYLMESSPKQDHITIQMDRDSNSQLQQQQLNQGVWTLA